jgi:hypothetical protein
MSRALLALTLLFASACDAPIEPAFSSIVERAPSKSFEPPACNSELLKATIDRAEQLECLAECETLAASCMAEPSPECWSCEHEAAICRSACPMGPFAP